MSCAPPEMSCFVMQGRFRRAVGAVLLPACSEGFGGGVGFGHACLLPGQARDGVSLFRARFARAGVGAGARFAPARFARLIARARRRTHLARPFPPGSFSRPQPSLSAEKPKGGLGSRLSTFILHHTGESQAPSGTKSGNIGQFSYNPLNRLDNRRLSLHPEPRAGDSRRRRSKRCSMKAVPSAGAARLTNGTVIVQATTMPESHIR